MELECKKDALREMIDMIESEETARIAWKVPQTYAYT